MKEIPLGFEVGTGAYKAMLDAAPATPPAGAKGETLTEDEIGLLCYKGNSVSFIHSKAAAKGIDLDRICDAVRKIGIVFDGKTHVADLILAFASPSPREAKLREALAETLRECESCWVNHYGDNPEGGPTPPHIVRAREALASTSGGGE